MVFRKVLVGPDDKGSLANDYDEASWMTHRCLSISPVDHGWGDSSITIKQY